MMRLSLIHCNFLGLMATGLLRTSLFLVQCVVTVSHEYVHPSVMKKSHLASRFAGMSPQLHNTNNEIIADQRWSPHTNDTRPMPPKPAGPLEYTHWPLPAMTSLYIFGKLVTWVDG